MTEGASGEREEGSREREKENGMNEENDVYIYIFWGKLQLTTLRFIRNYISSPEVCIYYYISFFPS